MCASQALQKLHEMGFIKSLVLFRKATGLSTSEGTIPDVQAGFRKGRETREQIANICWIIEKESSRKKSSISALLTMPKPLTV